MTKSVLVIDTPKCCYGCYYCRFHGKVGYRKCLLSKGEGGDFIDVQDGTVDILKERHKCCPLKPLPRMRTQNFYQDEMSMGFKDGWNECLLQITGETE